MDDTYNNNEILNRPVAHYKRKTSRRWTNEERNLFAEVLVDKKNNFLILIEKLAAKFLPNNYVLEKVRGAFEEELDKPNFKRKNEASNFVDYRGHVLRYEKLDTSVARLRNQMKKMKIEWRKYYEGMYTKHFLKEPGWYRILTPTLLETRLNSTLSNSEQPVTMTSNEDENQIFIIKDECDLDIEDGITIDDEIDEYEKKGENTQDDSPIENEYESTEFLDENDVSDAKSTYEANKSRDSIAKLNSQYGDEITSTKHSWSSDERLNRKRKVDEFINSQSKSSSNNSTSQELENSNLEEPSRAGLSCKRKNISSNEAVSVRTNDSVADENIEKSESCHSKHQKHTSLNIQNNHPAINILENSDTLPSISHSNNSRHSFTSKHHISSQKSRSELSKDGCCTDRLESKVLIELAGTFKSIVETQIRSLQTITEAHTK